MVLVLVLCLVREMAKQGDVGIGVGVVV